VAFIPITFLVAGSFKRALEQDMNRFRFQLLMGLLLMVAPYSALADDLPAGYVSLQVCNKSNVNIKGIEVNEATKGARWQIFGWIDIPAQDCAYFVAQRGVDPGTNGGPTYLGFAFIDSTGAWGAATADVPAYGTDTSGNPTFSKSDFPVCVTRADDTFYSTNDTPGENCSTWTLNKHPDEKLVPFTMALYFRPVASRCNFLGSCSGGDYYLDITVPDQGRHLHVARGLSPEDQGMQLLGSFLKAVVNAADAQNKQRAQAAAAAEAERQRQAYAASPQGRLEHARQQQAAREQKQKQILAADAAGDPNVKVEAQMIRREQEDNRQRWAGGPKSPAAYDPQWMGKNVAVVGTVSRVEVDPNGSPQWLTIYFKESPDATFVVCSPYPDMFQERVGLNLSALVGKTLEAAGQVETPYCGGKVPKGSIRVVESTQWKIH
jgi:hypothetical protein